MNIAEFLEARIAEDEAAAKAATDGPWRYNPGKVWHADLGKLAAARMGNPFVTGGQEFVGAGPDDGRNETTIGICTTGPEDNPESMADAAHIARHDPARVLAECAAKRAIVEAATSWEHEFNPSAWYACRAYQLKEDTWKVLKISEGKCNCGVTRQRSAILKPLAAVYASHPDYRQEWA